MPVPYTIETRTIGWVHEKSVLVGYIPRDDWMTLVKDGTDTTVRVCFDKDDDIHDIRRFEKMMADTARKISRFLVGDWIDDERGCGCLVGECLIAHDMLTREEFVTAAEDDDKLTIDVETFIETNYDEKMGLALRSMGLRIDSMMERHMSQHRGYRDVYGRRVASVIILDAADIEEAPIDDDEVIEV